jgi:hypothetical protein
MRDWLSTLVASGAQAPSRAIGVSSKALAESSQDDQSLALSMLLAGDFTPVIREQSRVFSSSTRMEHRFLNLVQKYVDEVSTLYARDPSRIFGAGDTPAPVYRKLREVYDKSDVNRLMSRTCDQLYTQNSAVIAVLPSNQLRTIKPMLFRPFEVTVETANPLFTSDLRYARAVRLRVPVSETADQIRFGFIYMSPSEIYLYDPATDTRTPIYGASTANPFGEIPLVVARVREPEPGYFFPPVNESLLCESVALCLSQANLDEVIRHSGYPQKVITAGEGESILAAEVDDLPSAPDQWVALPSGASLSVVHSQPQIAEMQNRIDADLRHFALINGISPDSFLKTYQNTQANAAQRHDRKIQRQRVESTMRRAERDLCVLVARVLSQVEVLDLPIEGLDCQVRYSEHLLDSDQSAAQARQIAYTAGELSPAQYIARRDNITERAALDKYKANLKLSAPAAPATTDAPISVEPGEPTPAPVEADTIDPSAILNGAQVQSAQAIIEAVAEGRLPRSSAVAMLVEFFGLDQPAADRVLGPVGQGFKPTPPPGEGAPS